MRHIGFILFTRSCPSRGHPWPFRRCEYVSAWSLRLSRGQLAAYMVWAAPPLLLSWARWPLSKICWAVPFWSSGWRPLMNKLAQCTTAKGGIIWWNIPSDAVLGVSVSLPDLVLLGLGGIRNQFLLGLCRLAVRRGHVCFYQRKTYW